MTTDLPARLEAVLTERFTELGNPFSAMRRQEKGPDGWPASHPVGPSRVADVLRELLAADPTPVSSAPADRAALRERIAALFRCPPGAERLGDATPGEIADAVLAEIPETTRLHDEILTLRADLAKFRDLLRTENKRANDAITRETTTEEAEEEQRLPLSQALGLGTGAPWDAIRDRATELQARLTDYENRITWGTTCGSCAHVLDSSIRETERAEQAEAAVERVRSVLESEAVVGRSALDYRGLITTALLAAPASGPGGVAGETQQPELQAADRIVAHVPTAGTDLHCLRCTPPPLGNIWTAVTAEELEDGGICTKCGTDVLIPQSERPAEHRCPRCGESLTNYFEDDLVWRTGDDRPYCSGECVVAAHRADLKKPPMDPVHILGIYADGQPEAHGALLATRCDACRHTLNWHRNDVGCTVVLCVCGCFQEPAAVSQPETEA